MTKEFDFSHGSTNPYKVEARHQLLRRCIVCGEDSVVTLDGSEYYAYFMRGDNIQKAFPTLTADEREVLISGTHPDCWDKLAEEGDDEEDEEDDEDEGG